MNASQVVTSFYNKHIYKLEEGFEKQEIVYKNSKATLHVILKRLEKNISNCIFD